MLQLLYRIQKVSLYSRYHHIVSHDSRFEFSFRLYRPTILDATLLESIHSFLLPH